MQFDMFHLHQSDVSSRFSQISLIHVYVSAIGAVYILCFTCLTRLTIFFTLSDEHLGPCSRPRIGSEEGPLFCLLELGRTLWILLKHGGAKEGL